MTELNEDSAFIPVPDFSIAPLDFSYRVIPSNELPPSIGKLGDISKSYPLFIRLDKERLTKIYPPYLYEEYMKDMYYQAKTHNQVVEYTILGKKYLEFPLDLKGFYETVYACFVPNTFNKKLWYCSIIRIGSKLRMMADLNILERDMSLLELMTNIKECGIDTLEDLKRHVCKAFLKAGEEKTGYRYVLADRVFYEIPLGIRGKENTDSADSVVTVKFVQLKNPKFGVGKEWGVSGIRIRNGSVPLADSIRDSEIKDWQSKLPASSVEKFRQQEEEKRAAKEKEILLQKQKEEEERRKAEEEEARRLEEQLIDFEPFPLQKIEGSGEGDYLHKLERFAYVKGDHYLKDDAAGISCFDPDLIQDAVETAFEKCRPFTDIQYYVSHGSKTAELQFILPGYEDKIVYAVFDQNRYREFPPWHFAYPVAGDKFHRVVKKGNYEKLYTWLCDHCDAATYQIDSPDALEKYIERCFFDAISSGSIYLYGSGKFRRAEFSLKIDASVCMEDDQNPNGENGAKIHAVMLCMDDKDLTWNCAYLTARAGNDVRFAISDDYRRILARDEENKQAENPEVFDDDVYERPESNQEPASVPGTAKPKKPKFSGVMVPGEDGKPIHLLGFCKEIPVEWLSELTKMAEEEIWEFDSKEPCGILLQYLKAYFIRLGFEEKIGIYRGKTYHNDFAAFHTGLFTRFTNDPIYACFKTAKFDVAGEWVGPEWRFEGFCSNLENKDLFEKMHRLFPGLPVKADFVHTKEGNYVAFEDYHLDLSRKITLKEGHVLKERGYRLPKKFLHRVFEKTRDSRAIAYLNQMHEMDNPEVRKSFWNETFSNYLESESADTYNELLKQMEFVLHDARKCNARKPIRMYYWRDNIIAWLLPLRFHEDGNLKNLALVVRRREGKPGYKGITVITIDEVYYRARVVENPNMSWVLDEVILERVKTGMEDMYENLGEVE